MEVTLDIAVADTHTQRLRWNKMTKLHDEETIGNRPNRLPLPHPQRCRRCRQLSPNHTFWTCPAINDCMYCKSRLHSHKQCPNPHVLCYSKTECVVPYTHRVHAFTNNPRCPAAHLHSTPYDDDYDLQGDSAYDDVDWEAEDRGD